ncbi:hypothetical protein QFZ82_007972 [Streptomyces sp. V4I23]|nr:hypothetical protein [Streptomyces sp. V4I23]MDQ1013404.1 hypothetical protein [Streptomyces sp. V4I23]
MSTPEERPNPDDALARARAAREQMAAALTEDQEPDADEPLGWQPIWKRPRKPKSKAAKKAELRKQRKRLQEAGKRRLAASPPRSRAGLAPGRAGSATRPRAAMPALCPGCGTPPPGCGDDAGHRPLSGDHDVLHPVAMHDIGWAPLSGLHSDAPG